MRLYASGVRRNVTTDESHAHGQELAAELRRSRLVTGMSKREVARRTGLSQSNVSQLESGQIVPSLDQVDHWGHAVGVSDLVRERLQALAETAASTEVMAVRHSLPAGLTAIGEDVGRLEASSAAVRSCEPLLVPGLLQTPGYARHRVGRRKGSAAPPVTFRGSRLRVPGLESGSGCAGVAHLVGQRLGVDRLECVDQRWSGLTSGAGPMTWSCCGVGVCLRVRWLAGDGGDLYLRAAEEGCANGSPDRARLGEVPLVHRVEALEVG